jgi:hypothetical protein
MSLLNPVIKKLQYKLQEDVLIIDAPPEFKEVLSDWKKTAKLHTAAAGNKTFSFALIFVKSEAEVKKAASHYIKLLEPDAVSWMVYPKKTSKKYSSTITRDSGWSALGELGYEGVSMVSVDDDWSAFRFRKADYIKTMKRRQELAMSKAGKERTKKAPK